ncbi:MAG: hypothetical protein HYZ53_09870 [Planctomycetes bacterium]|nr:hypothetical protein [Planctomycetota bacterium]
MVDSPAYRLNHEEVIKCLEEGVVFAEGFGPLEAVPDAEGRVEAVRFERLSKESGDWKTAGEVVTLAARTVYVAAGTTPNIIYEREHPGTFEVDPKRRCFKGYKAVERPDGSWQLQPAASSSDDPGFFTSYARNQRFITYYGDNHPVFAGSVVKAMASAKLGYPHIVKLFRRELSKLDPEDQPLRDAHWASLVARLDEELVPRVVEVKRLTPKVTEVILKAPLQARKFQPGQFFRLQNYEARAPLAAGTPLAMEGIALTGAWVDVEEGLLSLIILEIGASSRLCAFLRPGEPVVAMGPTGAPSEITSGETVLLAGGGLGNAVLFSIAKALRERGSRVVYFAGYREQADLFHREDIEEDTDQVIWSVDRGAAIEPGRPQDKTFVGNIVEAMGAYARGDFGEPLFPLSTVDRIIAIGSDKMMAAVGRARRDSLAPWLKGDHVAVSSINSPMQCMMKEVCGQCLQVHLDPQTGARAGVVFSCVNQDQPTDCVDWRNLADRLRQNSVEERLAGLWLDHLVERAPHLGRA